MYCCTGAALLLMSGGDDDGVDLLSFALLSLSCCLACLHACDGMGWDFARCWLRSLLLPCLAVLSGGRMDVNPPSETAVCSDSTLGTLRWLCCSYLPYWRHRFFFFLWMGVCIIFSVICYGLTNGRAVKTSRRSGRVANPKRSVTEALLHRDIFCDARPMSRTVEACRGPYM